MSDETKYEIVKFSASRRPDYKHFNYAVCDCLMANEGIQFPRSGHFTYHRFNCPRCGAFIGYEEGFHRE